jgi:putative endonuclease
MKQPVVYIITNKPYGTLYIGVTSNLEQRIWQHKKKEIKGFSQKYGLDRLVWYESHVEMIEAITKEKQMKECKRQWKIELIMSVNPFWDDLYDSLVG